MLKMELLCRREGGRSQRRFINVIEEDIQRVAVAERMEDDARDRLDDLLWWPLKEAVKGEVEEETCDTLCSCFFFFCCL